MAQPRLGRGLGRAICAQEEKGINRYSQRDGRKENCWMKVPEDGKDKGGKDRYQSNEGWRLEREQICQGPLSLFTKRDCETQIGHMLGYDSLTTNLRLVSTGLSLQFWDFSPWLVAGSPSLGLAGTTQMMWYTQDTKEIHPP